MRRFLFLILTFILANTLARAMPSPMDWQAAKEASEVADVGANALSERVAHLDMQHDLQQDMQQDMQEKTERARARWLELRTRLDRSRMQIDPKSSREPSPIRTNSRGVAKKPLFATIAGRIMKKYRKQFRESRLREARDDTAPVWPYGSMEQRQALEETSAEVKAGEHALGLRGEGSTSVRSRFGHAEELTVPEHSGIPKTLGRSRSSDDPHKDTASSGHFTD